MPPRGKQAFDLPGASGWRRRALAHGGGLTAAPEGHRSCPGGLVRLVGNRSAVRLVAVGTVVLGLLAAACGGGDDKSSSGSGASASSVDAKKATSVADFGGMDALIAAAKKEGKLNVITLPPDWANYGEI